MTRRRLTLILIALAALGVAAVLAVGLAHQSSAGGPFAIVNGTTLTGPVPPPGVGGVAVGPYPAAALRGPALEGSGSVDLTQFRGRPVLVNYWASWCGPCKDEAPALVAFAKAHPEVQLLGVDYSDDAANARSFAHAHGLSWPMIADPNGTNGERWRIVDVPMSFLVDAQGRVVYRVLGQIDPADLSQALARARTA